MSLPQLNPLEAPHVICPTCGSLLAPEPVRVGKAKVTEVIYVCVNPEKNCGWYVKATMRHMTGEGPFPLKAAEVEERRAQLANVKEFTQAREKNLSELIAMLPQVKRLLADFGEQPAGTSADTNATADAEPKTENTNA